MADTVDLTKGTKITLKIAGKDFDFYVTPFLYSSFLDGVSGDRKVQAMNNFVMTAVDNAQLKDLQAIITEPAFCMEIAPYIIEEYAPKIEVIVKK